MAIKLSPYHEIFYNEWKLDPFSSKYNIVFDQTLSASLDINRLKNSLHRFISDHLIINSHVMQTGDELHWVKNKEIIELEYFDVPYTRERIFNYVSTPFEIETNALYRFAIFTESNGNYRFIIVLHHIVIDGNCFNELIAEISNYYNNVNYRISQNLDEQVKYITDTTNKLYSSLEQDQTNNKQFWRDTLSDIEAVDLRFIRLDTYTDTQLHINVVEEIRFNFNEDMLPRLSHLKKRYGISEFMLSQIIFAILLNRYTSQEQFAISYPVVIKECVELIYGAGINTAIQPYTINNGTTLLDLISQTKLFISNIKENNYNYYPIYKIIETNNTHLLDVFFIKSNLKDTKFNFDNAMVIQINHEFNIDLPAKLVFEQEIKNGILNYCIRYNKTHTDTIILNNFIKHYIKLFNDIVSDLEFNITNKPVNIYEILDIQEYQQIVYEWNNSYISNLAYNKTIIQLFEEQVEKTPDNIALSHENIFLSYHDLNLKANQLSWYLRKTYNVKIGDLVALYFTANEYMIISILAVLKAGATYVPINSEDPDERILYILNDTKAKILITTQNFYNKMYYLISEKRFNIKILTVDSREDFLNINSVNNLYIINSKDDLAYVMYTSGTTGKPKGVMITQLCVTNFAKNECVKLNSSSVILSYSNYSFDGSIFDIFSTLLNGGNLVLINKHAIVNHLALLEIINKNKVNTMFITTALFNEYTLYEGSNPLLKINTILFGGEAVNVNNVNNFLNYKKIGDLYHVYGPTETTVFATSYKCVVGNKLVPIGVPLKDKTYYVLDSHKNIVPIGVIGELYIGGSSLAKGYLNLPEFTANNFLVNKFQTEKEKTDNINNIIYKTGDLVKYLPDGNLEYIGRSDHQVKIRGYRIELQEIENILSKHPKIKYALVIKKETYAEDTNTKNVYLNAYYISETDIYESELSLYFTKFLPSYMIPNNFIRLESIPVNKNGKLDKSRLSDFNKSNINVYKVPCSDLELKICKIFSEVLQIKLEDLDIDSDFFEFGGNSILAIRLVAKLQHSFNISVNEIFKLRTPRKIASVAKFVQNNLVKQLDNVKLLYKQLKYIKKKDIEAMNLQKNEYFKSIQDFKFKNSLKQINNILLTGSTGYLGCHILQQLLLTATNKIYLFIRDSSTEEAYIRLKEKFKFYFNENLDYYKDQLIIIVADIEKDNLSLNNIQYHSIANEIDSIIHVAALVKHYGSYDTFYRANVQATINLLELCKLTRNKDMHHISTIGVCLDGYIPNVSYYEFNEDSDISIIQGVDNIYTQTKFQAEKIIHKYRDLGINCNIYRVGNLVVNSKTYKNPYNIQENAFFNRAKAILNFGIIADELIKVEISPVDYTALAIVRLFNQKELINKIYHVFNPHTVNLLELFNQHEIINLTKVPLDKFIDTTLSHLSNNTNLVELFMLHQGWLHSKILEEITTFSVLQNKTERILSNLGFTWQPVTYIMLYNMINYSLKRGLTK